MQQEFPDMSLFDSGNDSGLASDLIGGGEQLISPDIKDMAASQTKSF